MFVMGCWKKCITAAPETVSSSACKSGVQGNHQGTQGHRNTAAPSGWGAAHEGSIGQPHLGPSIAHQTDARSAAASPCIGARMQDVPGLALLCLPAAAPFSIAAARVGCTLAARSNVTRAVQPPQR